MGKGDKQWARATSMSWQTFKDDSDNPTHESLPHFDDPIPATSKNHRRLHGMPNDPDCRPFVMSMIFLQHSRFLKNPKTNLSIGVSAADKLAVGTDNDIAGISCSIVTFHFLLVLE